MHRLRLSPLALTFVLAMIAISAPATAQTFEGEIDCGDEWNAGDSVPFTVRFEEQGFFEHTIDTQVAVTVPGLGQFTLVEATFVLGSNQDRDFNRMLNLPVNAPNGSYQMSVTSDDGNEVAFDTCSFKVR